VPVLVGRYKYWTNRLEGLADRMAFFVSSGGHGHCSAYAASA